MPAFEKQKEVFAALDPEVQARILTNVKKTVIDSVSASITFR